MRSLAPSARSNSSTLTPGLPHPVRSAFRFSQPLDGLLLESPGGLVSCHWHSWGSPYRAFPPMAAPHSHRVWLPHILRILSPSTTAGCVRTDSQALLIRKQVRPNKYAEYVVLIRPRVRSHPALVLSAADGRYSRGVYAFQGMSPVNPG